MQRLARPSPSAHWRSRQRGGAASSHSPAQVAEERRASWVVRLLTVAALVGGVLHFLESFEERPSPPSARSPAATPTTSPRSERRRAASPSPAPVEDDSVAASAQPAKHDAWEAADTVDRLDEQPDEQDSERGEPPGYDTGIVITPVAEAARFEKAEPGLQVTRVTRTQPDIAAHAAPERSEARQVQPHVDPAIDTGIVVTPMGFPASAK